MDRAGPPPDPSDLTDSGLSPEMTHARRLAAALDVEHVSLVLFAGSQHRAVVRGSDPDLVAFGDMVATVGEGPAHEVLRTGRSCRVEDLPSCTDRWPVLLVAYTVPDHLRSLLVVPVATDPRGLPEDVLGVVVLGRDRRRPFTTSEVTRAGQGAGAIAAALLARAAEQDEAVLEDDLDDLIDPRTGVVPCAVGVLSQLRGLDRAEALRQLGLWFRRPVFAGCVARRRPGSVASAQASVVGEAANRRGGSEPSRSDDAAARST